MDAIHRYNFLISRFEPGLFWNFFLAWSAARVFLPAMKNTIKMATIAMNSVIIIKTSDENELIV